MIWDGSIPKLIHSHNCINRDGAYWSVLQFRHVLKNRDSPSLRELSPARNVFFLFMMLNIISDFQQSWLFTLLPSIYWRRDERLLGRKQDIAKWPKATSLALSEDLYYPMSWPTLCPQVTLSKKEATAEVMSVGGLCPTICTTK